jgi:hypothetical protein
MSATNMFIIYWKRKHETRPVFEEKNKDTELRILWLQWPRLKLVNKVLYREYEEDESTWLQFVVPIQMRDRVLFEIRIFWTAIRFVQVLTDPKLMVCPKDSIVPSWKWCDR